MKIKTLLLCTATLSLGAYSAYGETSMSGPRYVPRDDVSQRGYTATDHMQDRADEESYGAYEQREQCQNYRELPRSLVDHCATQEEEIVTAAIETQPAETRLLPIVQSYTLHFDFDKSNVRANEAETINRVMREIDKYDPRQVTVTGYTDSSGEMDYNQALSRDREQAVSTALLERGVENKVLDREARGEHEQAVKTPDDTRNQENRRVVIDFRR